MARGEIVVNGSELLEHLCLRVRMPRMFGLRIWFATKLFELAGWVSGTNVVVEVDDDGEPDFAAHLR